MKMVNGVLVKEMDTKTIKAFVEELSKKNTDVVIVRPLPKGLLDEEIRQASEELRSLPTKNLIFSGTEEKARAFVKALEIKQAELEKGMKDMLYRATEKAQKTDLHWFKEQEKQTIKIKL